MNQFKRIIFLVIGFVLFISLFSFNSLSPAIRLQIDSPKDMAITEETRLPVSGSAPGAREVYINGIKVILDKDMKFEAMSLLNPGKNVVKVMGVYAGGKRRIIAIRILRIVSFDDIKGTFKGKEHWAKPQIISLASLGIIEGYPDNTFQPSASISRSEFATWMARAMNLKTAVPNKDVYFDVPKEHWRAPYIKAVVDGGYMSGLTQTDFGMFSGIKRGDVIKTIIKAYDLEMPRKRIRSLFMDVPRDSEYAPYIYSAYYNDLIVGIGKKLKLFEPDREMNRAEAAMLFSRLRRIKSLRAMLYDFEEGFTAQKYSRISTKPIIRKLEAYPLELVIGEKSLIHISAYVVSEQGKSDIYQVWADLTSLGGPNNAKLNSGNDDQFELIFSPTSELYSGENFVPVKAANKSGLETSQNIKFTVVNKK